MNILGACTVIPGIETYSVHTQFAVIINMNTYYALKLGNA